MGFGWLGLAVLAGYGMAVCGTASLGLSWRGSHGQFSHEMSWKGMPWKGRDRQSWRVGAGFGMFGLAEVGYRKAVMESLGKSDRVPL